jgi:hypothetical protein
MADHTDILLKEYELHRSELKLRIDHRMRGFAFFLSALVLALGLALKDGVVEIFLILPWFILGFFAFLGHQIMCAQLTVSYLKKIEEKLECIDYESRVTASQWHELKFYKNTSFLLQLMSIIPFLIILVYSCYKSFLFLNSSFGLFLSCSYLILILFLFVISSFLIFRGVRNANNLSNPEQLAGG